MTKKQILYLLKERDKEDYHVLRTPFIIILKEILFIELHIELYSIICTRSTCPIYYYIIILLYYIIRKGNKNYGITKWNLGGEGALIQ